jgi:hypothetical protein
MEYLVLRTISLVHINYGLTKSLIEITYLYDHQNRIQQHQVGNMWIYTPHNLHSSSCNHTAPSITVSTWKLGHSQIFPIYVSVMSCTYRYHHLTTYIMGIRDLHKIKGIIHHTYNTLGLYGDLHKKPVCWSHLEDNSKH